MREMGKQIEFELSEISTKEAIDKHGLAEEVKVYIYKNEEYDISIKVKDTDNADLLGLPTDSLKDTITVEFGAKNIQTKILDNVSSHAKELGKSLSTKDTTVTITASDRKLLRQGPSKADLKDAPRLSGHRGRPRK